MLAYIVHQLYCQSFTSISRVDNRIDLIEKPLFLLNTSITDDVVYFIVVEYISRILLYKIISSYMLAHIVHQFYCQSFTSISRVLDNRIDGIEKPLFLLNTSMMMLYYVL